MKSNASPQRLSCGITEAQEEEAMFGSIMHRQGEQAFAHDPALRGYHAVYREGEINHCPGCGRSHWIIGRFSAECGFCATALALAAGGLLGMVLRRRSPRGAPIWAGGNGPRGL